MSNIVTPEFRVSYPSVFKAKKNDMSGKTEYSLVALFPKGADLSALKKAMEEACAKKWGDKKNWPKNLYNPLRDQAEKAKEDETTGKKMLPPGYEAGAMFMTIRSQQRPGVVDQNVQPVLDESVFYAGCYARASVRAYAYGGPGTSFKPGVSFGLGNVQKTRDGEAFTGRTKAEEDFTAVASEETAEQGAGGIF